MFRQHMNKRSLWTNTLEYNYDNKILELLKWGGIMWYSAFVDFGITTAKLSALLKHGKFSNKTRFNTKIYNALYWKVLFAGLLQVFAHWVTYTIWSQL